MKQKLIFEEITARNFRSISNTPFTIMLNESETTLVCSTDNGAGKSTLLVHALYFVLFGKPYDKENSKPGLVNTRNNKDCLVTVKFQTAGSSYEVSRGIKPNIFEIKKDGIVLDSEAAGKDHQKVLESIIGMDDKIFCNTVVLGKERFQPFSTMDAASRRNHGEQIFDLVVFSRMNEKAKEVLKEANRIKADTEYKLSMKAMKKTEHTRVIGMLEDQIQNQKTGQDVKIAGLNVKVQELQSSLQQSKVLQSKVQENIDSYTFQADLVKKRDMMHQIDAKKQQTQNLVDKFNSLTTCPTCKQDVSEEHKQVCTADQVVQLGKLENAHKTLIDIVKGYESQKQEKDALDLEWRGYASDQQQIQFQISSLQNEIASLKKDMETSDISEKLKKERLDLLANQDEIDSLQLQLLENNKDVQNAQSLLLVLKDDGAKASIVEQYIPFLNERINTFLDKMNLFVNISIDPQFNLEMYAADRKNQTLGSLSTGQHTRIDLGVLFAWRAVAQTRATIATNLLILDEVLESLSATGIEDFMNLYRHELSDNSNLFVITQRNTEFEPHFDATITLNLKNGFTELIKGN